MENVEIKGIWARNELNKIFLHIISSGFKFLMSKTVYVSESDDHIELQLEKKSLISGIKFDNINVIERFCFNYTLGATVRTYRDNLLQLDQTVSYDCWFCKKIN